MTIKIEFPSDRKDIALAIGRALCEIGGEAVGKTTVVKETVKAGELEHIVEKTTSHGQLAADGAGLLDNDGVDIEDITQAEINAGNLPTDDVPPPPVDDSELDARGLPWDKRIHSANKSKNTDGTWRYSRKPKNFETKEQWNIYIEQIEEELKGSEDVPPPVTDEPNAGDVFGQSETPPPVEDDVPPPPADEYPEKTFGELMTLITSNQKNGSVAAINDVLAEMGISGTGNSALPVLKSDHPERISEAYAKLEGKL